MTGRELGSADARLVLPEGLRASPSTPPAPDVGRLPGARLVLFEASEAPGVELLAGCARAPSDRWVTGLEALVFERALGLVLAPSGRRAQGLTRVAAPPPGGAFASERWSGGTEDGRSLEVHLLLGFAGADADAIACAVSCSRSRAGPPGPSCATLVDAVALHGELGPPPPPGPFARALIAAAEHPGAALAAVVGLGSVGVLALLATRPRLRPTARRAAGRARSPRSSRPPGRPPPR